jgi:hypothetical protein
MFVICSRGISVAGWAAVVLAGRQAEVFWIRQLATSTVARLIATLFKQICQPVRSVMC